MTIGALGEATGVGAETTRYYDSTSPITLDRALQHPFDRPRGRRRARCCSILEGGRRPPRLGAMLECRAV